MSYKVREMQQSQYGPKGARPASPPSPQHPAHCSHHPRGRPPATSNPTRADVSRFLASPKPHPAQ